MAEKTFVGWIILAVALIVPGVMFRNWLKQLDKPPEPRRIQAAGNLFGPTKVTPPNPLAGSNSAATRASADRAHVAVAIPGSVTSSMKIESAPVAAIVVAEPRGGVAGPPALRFNPRVDRDPMLSLADMKKLRELALPPPTPVPSAPAKHAKRRPPPSVESLVKLSGISDLPGAPIMAIVNNRVVREGERVEVSGGGKKAVVTILRITPTTVTFEHGSKHWSEALDK